MAFDTLIVAAGSNYNYFRHDHWQRAAPDLKTVESALEIRARILRAFEAAELEPDPNRRVAWLTFVVVGAGPTGVEMAGQIAEIARDVRADFKALDSSRARLCSSKPATGYCQHFRPHCPRKRRTLSRGLG